MTYYTIHFTYHKTGLRDKAVFTSHPLYMDALNSLKNYCSEFLKVTSVRTTKE